MRCSHGNASDRTTSLGWAQRGRMVTFGLITSHWVEAMRDIAKGEELFAMYGAGYWKRYQKYKVGEDPEIVVGRKYEQERSQV